MFTTVETVTIATGETEVEVLARHCEPVDAELAGRGTGAPGLVVNLARAPVIAPTGDGLDLVVGVETDAEALEASAPAVRHEGKAYRIWREVENFSNLGADRFVYVSDRLAGNITFAPSARMCNAEGELQEAAQALAEVPPADSEIRVWYRRGGGSNGNVTAGLLTTLKDPIPGVEVTVRNSDEMPAQTDPAGRFTLAAVPAQSQLMLLMRDGYETKGSWVTLYEGATVRYTIGHEFRDYPVSDFLTVMRTEDGTSSGLVRLLGRQASPQ